MKNLGHDITEMKPHVTNAVPVLTEKQRSKQTKQLTHFADRRI